MSTSPPSFSQQPSPTQLPPQSPTNNNGGSISTAEANLSSSASLYLYTFLATLVLLLVVSAAIVVRSLMLRRRHRIMIDEAIRNGTLPPPFAYQRPRVDLSKKPKLWNAWIDTTPELSKTGGISREKEWYWDMIKPFSATLPLPLSASGGNADDRQQNRPSTSSLIDRLRQIGHVGGARASAANDSTNPSTAQANAVLANLDSGNVSLKVAVLIAMPRKPSSPSPPSSSSPQFPFMFPAPRSPTSPTSPTSPSIRPLSATTITNNQADEQPLPHLEMGVTEVRVVPHADEADTELQEKRSIAT